MKRQLTIPCKTPEHTVQVFAELLSQKLLSVGVAAVEEEPGVLCAELELSTFAWKMFHPFKGVSGIRIQLTEGIGSVVVDYDVRLTALAWGYAASGPLIVYGSYLDSHDPWRAVTSAVIVSALYYGSRLLTRFKLDDLFEDVGRQFRSVKVIVSETPGN